MSENTPTPVDTDETTRTDEAPTTADTLETTSSTVTGADDDTDHSESDGDDDADTGDSDDDTGGDSDSDSDDDTPARADGRDPGDLLVQEGDIAADYLERLLDIVDYDGDIDLDVENDRAMVAIVGSDLGSLVGPRGETLDALQELTRLAVAQKTGVRSRLMLDVSGHRERRRTELRGLAATAAEAVRSSGQPERLAPMNPFERKVVHDAIAATPGVRSESEGEEPSRRVVVLPDAG